MNLRGAGMKYLLVGLFLAAIAAVEVFHELKGDRAQEAAICTAADGKSGATWDLLLAHLRSH